MILWPFSPNWSSPYNETFSYVTEIITSDAGHEQRRAWRQNARRSVGYTGAVQRDRFRAMRRTLAQQGETIVFPDEVRRARLAAPAVDGAMTAQFGANPPAWLAPGRDVIFEDLFTQVRTLRHVDAVSGAGVATFADQGVAWAAGTKVMPALVGRMSQNMKTTALTDAVSTIAVDLDVEPGTEIEDTSLPLFTFNGIEVLTHRPNWATPLQTEVQDPTMWTDNQMGVRAPYVIVPFGTEVLQAEHVIQNQGDLDAVLGLFHRSKGRCGEFYVPSWTSDIALVEPTAAGSQTFVVDGHDFFDAYDGDRVRRAFFVNLPGTEPRCFLIDQMAKSTSGPARTIITTEQPSPVTIPAAASTMICWMLVCRFASDEIAVGWRTDTVATILVNVQSTENLL